MLKINSTLKHCHIINDGDDAGDNGAGDNGDDYAGCVGASYLYAVVVEMVDDQMVTLLHVAAVTPVMVQMVVQWCGGDYVGMLVVEVEMVLVTMLCVGAVTLNDVTTCPQPAGTAPASRHADDDDCCGYDDDDKRGEKKWKHQT